MRFRTLTTSLILLSSLALTSSLLASERQNAPRDDGSPAGGARLQSVDFPRIALNQARPRPRLTPACVGCEDLPPFDDGGDYTAGGCNCRRNCVEGAIGCSLGSNNQCKATAGGSCVSCINSNCI
jgi:hypothetical protein